MTKLKQIGKKAMCLALSALTAGYMLAVPKQVKAEKINKPGLELKIENVFNYNKSLRNDKLRTTLSYDKLLFRLDKNEGRQSQYMFSLKTINTKNTKLTLLHSGSIKEKIENKQYGQTYDFGAVLIQNLGNLPIIGETKVKVTQINSFKKHNKPYQRFALNLIGENIDLAYQANIKRDRTIDPHYYVAYHNDYLHASLGKTNGKKIEGVLLTKNNPNLGLFVIGNYDLESRVLTLTAKNAFKNANKNIYNQQLGRLASDILTFGTIEVNFPIFSSYLTLGDITNNINVKTGNGQSTLEGELGAKIAKNIGIGGGVLVNKQKNTKLELKPIVSGYFKTKVLGQEIYFEGSLKDGKINCYAYTHIRF